MAEMSRQAARTKGGMKCGLKSFLLEQSLVFCELLALTEKELINTDGDKNLKQQCERSNSASSRGKWALYNEMEKIGEEIHEATGALHLSETSGEHNMVLDLSIAPGGYSASVLKHSPKASIFGITLPVSQGGHDVLIAGTSLASRVAAVIYKDITMFATEFGLDKAPMHHPTAAYFTASRPFPGKSFELVFCNGTLLSRQNVGPHRQKTEPTRLLCAQLIIALQRIKSGGTVIVLLHKVGAWETAYLLYQFDHFANIQLFKPKKIDGHRSSFYLIAKNVHAQDIAAQDAVEEWKEDWCRATFGGADGTGAGKDISDEGIKLFLEIFGNRLVELANPIWAIQVDALRRNRYIPEALI